MISNGANTIKMMSVKLFALLLNLCLLKTKLWEQEKKILHYAIEVSFSYGSSVCARYKDT